MRRKEYEQKREEYMRQIEPDLNRIQAEIDQVKQAGVAVTARKQKLMDDYNEEVVRAQRAYRDRIRRSTPTLPRITRRSFGLRPPWTGS